MSEGGRHVARREDDKCAYGSLFIGQSSGTQVETEHGRRKPVGAGEAGEIRCEIRFAQTSRPVFVAIHEPEPQKHPFPGPSHSFH